MSKELAVTLADHEAGETGYVQFNKACPYGTKLVELDVTLEEELKYLRYFFQKADFGPAHGDVVQYINQAFEKEGNKVPEGYNEE
jgi:hypothetical protein